jgi:hypothetical protein
MSFFSKTRGQEGKTGPVRVLVQVGGRGYKERVKEGKYDRNIIYSCMKIEK